MTKFLKKFCKEVNGAVTVDWVVLCAAIVGLATIAYVQIETQTAALYSQAATDIGSQVGQ